MSLDRNVAPDPISNQYAAPPYGAKWDAPALDLLLWLVAALALVSLSPLAAQAQYNGPPTNYDRSNSATPTNDQALLFPSTPDTQLMPGDEIVIRLFGDAEYSVNARIAIDGTVILPLLGSVDLRGLTVNNAELLIAQKLQAAGMYRDPQVLLQISEGPSSVITVSGEMHVVLPVIGSRSLLAVLAQGGGLPSGASRVVTVVRAGQTQPISVDVGNDPVHSASANIPIFPGDTVIVSRIGVVYVMGEFKNPGVVSMTNYGPLTLTQVSALVGGPVYDAKYGELHIIRTVGDHRTVVTLNIKNILYGKAPDPIMQPNDIVFLPPSAFKASIANGSLGSILGIISFGIAAFATFR